MKDKLEIRRLRIELQKALKDLEVFEKRNTRAINFIEKYSIAYNDTPEK